MMNTRPLKMLAIVTLLCISLVATMVATVFAYNQFSGQAGPYAISNYATGRTLASVAPNTGHGAKKAEQLSLMLKNLYV